jgi:hypothetical protein
MTRALRLTVALAVLSACQSPTAPRYEGACVLTFPRSAEAPQHATLCYDVCPWHAAQFAAEGDGLYQARMTPCGVTP